MSNFFLDLFKWSLPSYIKKEKKIEVFPHKKSQQSNSGRRRLLARPFEPSSTPNYLTLFDIFHWKPISFQGGTTPLLNITRRPEPDSLRFQPHMSAVLALQDVVVSGDVHTRLITGGCHPPALSAPRTEACRVILQLGLRCCLNGSPLIRFENPSLRTGPNQPVPN